MDTAHLILGFLASTLATLIGAFAGGGVSLILFPLLLMFAPGTYASLLTTNKVSATIMTLVSGKIHHSRNKIDKFLLWILIIFGILGTAIGTYLVQFQLNEDLFKQILAITLLTAAIYLFFSKKSGLGLGKPKKFEGPLVLLTILFALFINVLNGLFGGTGIFTTIFLVAVFQLPFIQAVAYSSISNVVINVIQTGYLLSTEPIDPILAAFVALGGLTGSYIGTHLQYLKGNTWVKAASISMMVLIATRIIWQMYF